MDKDCFSIAKWIADYLSKGEVEDEFCRELEEWRKEEGNEHLLRKIEEEARVRIFKRRYDDFSVEEGWKQLSFKRFRRRRIRRIYRIAAVAAVLVVMVGSILMFHLQQTIADRSDETVSVVEVSVGSAKARLVLPDGQVIDLEKEQGVIVDSSVWIQNSQSGLTYRLAEVENKIEPVFHELEVPICGEYRLELSDGTVVFLNAKTKLRFPNFFTGGIREVELEGEAYFKVARDSLHPFIVKTAYSSVYVYGTEFNVFAYPEEPEMHTTLVEGKVTMERGTEQQKLLPGEQWCLHKESGAIVTRKVDVNGYVAWKDGRFRFKDMRLEEIMRAVSRWYGVTVDFQSEDLKELRFGCNLNRHQTIDPLLRVFESNGKIKIERQGNQLKIKRGR